jgi:hypothetical protein
VEPLIPVVIVGALAALGCSPVLSASTADPASMTRVRGRCEIDDSTRLTTASLRQKEGGAGGSLWRRAMPSLRARLHVA